MTVTLDLKPELEAGLLMGAKANGMGLEDYLLRVVEGAVLARRDDGASATGEERVEEIRRMAAFQDRYGLSLDEPMGRDMLHDGHRF